MRLRVISSRSVGLSVTQWAKRVWELEGTYVDQGKGKNLLVTFSVVV